MTTKLISTLALAGLMTASQASLAVNPPKMKMTTDIPVSMTAPDKMDTSIGTLEVL